MPQRAELESASLSHPGMVRSHNEDSIYVDNAAGIAVLADGMGGYSAGEVASGIAVTVVSNGMLEPLRSGRELSKVDANSGLTHVALLLQEQIAAANKGIYEAAQARPECAGMGTTIVTAVFCGNRVSIGHIGDSRCYRLRADKFEQLTHDHSLLQEQIDSGQITVDQARYSMNKNLVTRALGIEAIVPVDISEYRVEANDIYLLCSDGLTDMVDTDVLHRVVDLHRQDLPQATAELVDIANRNGGRDNISVIIVQVPAEFLPDDGWAKRFLAKKKEKAR
jgi:protein phosphatase